MNLAQSCIARALCDVLGSTEGNEEFECPNDQGRHLTVGRAVHGVLGEIIVLGEIQDPMLTLWADSAGV